MLRFARTKTQSGFVQFEKYKQECAHIWARQARALSGSAINTYDDSDSDISDMEFSGKMGSMDALAIGTAVSSKLLPYENEVDDLKETLQIASAKIELITNTSTFNDYSGMQSSSGLTRPTKAVKKINRYIRFDGKECIDISFKILTHDENN